MSVGVFWSGWFEVFDRDGAALDGAEKLHAEHTSGRLKLEFTTREQGRPDAQPQLRAFVLSLPGRVADGGAS